MTALLADAQLVLAVLLVTDAGNLTALGADEIDVGGVDGSLLRNDAALLVGSIGIQWSRWYLAHPKIFTVAAVIPMFPGISAYTAMISAVKISHFGYSEEMMIMLLSNFLKASSIVGALSIGLSIPGLWLYRKRPRV